MTVHEQLPTSDRFVYSGWGTVLGSDTIQYDTINILSIPAFHWIVVPYYSQKPRFAHTCNAVGGSQIVIVCGLDANSNITFTSTFNSSAEPFTQGLAIFDMTTLKFAEQYTAGAKPYEQSDPVKQFYSQSQK